MSQKINTAGVWMSQLRHMFLMGMVLAGLLIGSAGAAEVLQAPLLDGSHGKRAHRMVESWIRDAEVPQHASLPINVTGLMGVRVTLRMDGVPVGAGEAYRQDLAAATDALGPAVDLTPLLIQASRKALYDARQTLRTAQETAAKEGRALEDVHVNTLEDIAGDLLVDIQLAEKLTTIKLAPGAPADAIYGSFAPGYHGLRLPGAQGSLGAVQWPATAIARNTVPHSQITQLLADVGYAPAMADKVARPGGPTLQRFSVRHFVRPTSGAPVTELVRGNVILPPHNISGRTVDNMADRLAEHLQRRFTADGQIRGTYLPTSNQYSPSTAGDEEAALACYALVRQLRQQAQLRPDDPSVGKRLAQVRATADSLGVRLLDQAHATEPAAASLILMTLIDAQVPGENTDLRDKLGRFLLSLRDPAGGFFASKLPNDTTPRVNQATRALIVAGLSALYTQTRDAQLGNVVRDELNQLWQQAQQAPNVAALPWFMAAHHRTAKLLASDEVGREAVAEREQGLAVLVVVLCEQQVIEPPLLGPADVVGGFELVAGPAGSPPNPDWRTSQLLGFLALALREPGITANRDSMGWMLSAGLAARFLAQLMVDEPSCYYVRSMPDALGGIRLSLWDNRLAVAPQAMTLLALTELQQTLASFVPAGR